MRNGVATSSAHSAAPVALFIYCQAGRTEMVILGVIGSSKRWVLCLGPGSQDCPAASLPVT